MRHPASITLFALLVGCPSPATDDGTPAVVTTSPSDGATGVDPSATITVTFDAAIQGELLDSSTFALVPSTAGQHAWNADTLTASFDPTGALLAGTPYTVTLTPALGLADTVSFSFTVAESDGPDDTDDTDEPVHTDTVTLLGDEVTVTANADSDRSYTLTTTHPLRDGLPASGQITITELPGQPRLRTASTLIDALFALAVQETRDASVSQLTDGAFDNGAPVACDCFETGALWPWVWTRDIAYAARLGLPLVDPQRTADSLRFKLSDTKDGQGIRIVQDTGTGGSWPVSTDRAVWALGARTTLAWLHGAERTTFRDEALVAMAHTIADDRTHVFDAGTGLYRGEQSFLDWREQSYPSWTADDPVHIAMSRTLSTNVAHLVLLRTAAALGTETSHPDAGTWATWADDLAAAIDAALWLPDDGLYSAMIPTTLDPTPLRKFEWLGSSLAILEGVATPEQARSIVDRYPHTGVGPPVIWPQQPGVPIYHNRGIWPFVTSFGLLAARQAGHDAAFDAALESLITGAALNLSNMENFDFLTLANFVDAGPESGPVVNSRRQIWSVAGYLGAFTEGVLGVRADADGLHVAPFVTAALRDGWLADASELRLEQLTWRGRTVDIVVTLPPVGTLAAGAYAVDAISLDGAPATPPLSPDDLDGVSAIGVTLTTAGAPSPATHTVVIDQGDHQAFWAPPEPADLALTWTGTDLSLAWTGTDEAGVAFQVYRDGVRVASDLTSTSWLDTDIALDDATACYAVEATYVSSGNASHHSPPACFWGADAERARTVSTHRITQLAGDGVWDTAHGRPHYRDWGEPTDALAVHGFTTDTTGPHLLQLVAGNGAGGLTTGITAAHKRVEVYDSTTDTLVAEGSAVVPHQGTWADWTDSSFVSADLEADVPYRIEVHDAPNMSHLAHYLRYTGGLGGGPDPYGFVNITALKVLVMGGTAVPRSTGDTVPYDGTDDIDAFAAGQRVGTAALGAPLAPWEDLAVAWDDRFLYLSLVSPAFEQDFEPWMVYLEAGDAPLGSPVPASGIDYAYGTVTTPAAVPFTPTHVITNRAVPGAGPDGGTWPGVWSVSGGVARQLHRFEPGEDWFLATDRHTIAVRFPRALLRDATHVRLVSHVLHGAAGNEWKTLFPAGHTPWAAGGAHVLIHLDAADPSVAGWTVVTP